jgi:uncharacterized protein (UPF0276 family)
MNRLGEISPIAGIGLRQPHGQEIAAGLHRPGWLEVHAENVMGYGPVVRLVDHMRHDYALSVHGVGLSLGSAGGVDHDHLRRLKDVCDRFEPALVSEHLAWSIGEGVYLNDLLPVPHDEEALAIVARNIEVVQETLRRPILIENVSTYVGFAHATMTEPEFLTLLTKRTGCGILLDVNNVFVSAHNMGFDAADWITALPGGCVGEIHLGGHARKQTDDGVLLIDDHASAVCRDVWELYALAVSRFGRRPTLIEWDSALPALSVLIDEARRADAVASCATASHAA